ncbi:MAG: hypothetical protein ACRCYA_05580 [Cetobacterium sp.]|uniref:hypothetical protein n=1 Tax=Cetobacterium sp. TaxID=2071632 RepID=UPI003EE5DA09
MELKNIKEKLDFMKKYSVDSMKFMAGPFCEERECELCFYIDGPEESLTLLIDGVVVVHAWDRKYFEQLLKEQGYEL